MLFNFIAYFVIVFLLTHQYSLGKSFLVGIIVWIIAFALSFVLELIGVTLGSSIARAVGSIIGGKKDVDISAESVRKHASSADNLLPFASIFTIFLSLVIFRLLHLSGYIQAVYLLTYSMFTVIAYLDRFFTHMYHRLVPTLIAALFYLIIGFRLLS